MHRVTLGNFELTAVSDGIYHLDGGAMFGVVPKTMWQRKVRVREDNLIPLGLNSIVIRGGSKTVLIETGLGNKLSDKMAQIFGMPAKFLDNLHASGIAPEDIDVVINSHLHFDHSGWNTMRVNGKVVPTFPRATYYAQEEEVLHGRKQYERDAISYISDNYDPLVESGQMQLLRGNREIIPGVSVELYPGHTRAMQAIMIRSGGHTACYIADLIPTMAHLDLVWVMGYDLYPLETIESRKRFYAQAIPEKWLTLFTHDPDKPWAYLEKNEKGKVVAGDKAC
jgi:glyoxylase-like metal-dependent hydrolase (beta-lactamase superfamily II)